MDSKQQQYEMAAVRRAAEAEADALKAAATQEAARLRKNAEEEVCILCVAAVCHLSSCSSRLNTHSFAPASRNGFRGVVEHVVCVRQAASLRKLAEEEAAMLRVVETKKREMEKEVATAAAQAREKMAGEVEAIRKRAEAEVSTA